MTAPTSFSMKRFPLRITREYDVTWVDGVPQAMSKDFLLTYGMVLPVDGKELLLVPEGDRFRENIWIFTQDRINDNDIVHHDGKFYAVQRSELWLTYRRARAVLIDEGPLKSGQRDYGNT